MPHINYWKNLIGLVREGTPSSFSSFSVNFSAIVPWSYDEPLKSETCSLAKTLPLQADLQRTVMAWAPPCWWNDLGRPGGTTLQKIWMKCGVHESLSHDERLFNSFLCFMLFLVQLHASAVLSLIFKLSHLHDEKLLGPLFEENPVSHWAKFHSLYGWMM